MFHSLTPVDGDELDVFHGVAFFVFGGFEPPAPEGAVDGHVDGFAAAAADDVDVDDLAGLVDLDLEEDSGELLGEEVAHAGLGEPRADGLDLPSAAGFDLSVAEFDTGDLGEGVGFEACGRCLDVDFGLAALAY